MLPPAVVHKKRDTNRRDEPNASNSLSNWSAAPHPTPHSRSIRGRQLDCRCARVAQAADQPVLFPLRPPIPPQETHCHRRQENRPPCARTVEKRYCSSATSSTVKTPKLTPSPIMTKYPVHIFRGWLGSSGSPKNDSLQRYCANPPSLRQGVTFAGHPLSKDMAKWEGGKARPSWGETATGVHHHARRLHPRGRRHDRQRLPPQRLPQR